MMVEPSLELLTPFLGYLITADGAIHTAEIDAMAGLLRDGVISAATQNELALIITDDRCAARRSSPSSSMPSGLD